MSRTGHLQWHNPTQCTGAHLAIIMHDALHLRVWQCMYRASTGELSVAGSNLALRKMQKMAPALMPRGVSERHTLAVIINNCRGQGNSNNNTDNNNNNNKRSAL